MRVQDISIDALQEYKNNPRDNEGAVEAVAESIKQFGFKVPIVVDNKYVIVAGHTRYKAARRLGFDTVPCIVADDLTPEQIKAYRLADNKVGEFAEWDFEALDKELSELTAFDFDMTAFGFDESIIEELEQQSKIERDDLSEDVRSVYEVIVECSNEIEQEEVYNRLREEGFICRVLTL